MPASKKIDLAAHIATLRKREAEAPPVADDAIVFWGTSHDKQYLPLLKGCVGSATTFVRLEPVTTLTTVQVYCRQKRITRVISSSISLLEKLLGWEHRAKPSLSNYAGSYFTLPGFKDGDPEIEVVFIAPLKQLATIPYGKFMATRFISKLTKPEDWFQETPFPGFDLITASNEASAFSLLSDCFLICIDIETFRENATIRCLSYTGFFIPESGSIKSYSTVLALEDEYALAIMRKWNWQLKAPKVFQNGKYDISYLARYSAPVYNYLYDTAHLFHSWYSELPKDLGFLNAFFIRKAMYWKDLAKTNDLHEYYRYNALDTWGTGNCFLAMILEAPQFAINNYLLEFPLVFPCHLCEMTGMARDMEQLAIAKQEQDTLISQHTASLNKMLDIPADQSFNTNSSPQMKSLLKILGCGDLTSADEKNLKKARFRHPFNARIINHVITIRKARKLVSTYLTPGKEFNNLSDTGSRVLFSLNPQGTDSSRLASREHHFWTGCNIQQIPRGPAVKRTIRADPGFYLAEVDLEQAESRDTAYISGDPALIENVEHSPDFHCANASAFFGIPFEELYDIATGKKLNTKIRDLAKNVNHGANYNMGAFVLVETMGEENILRAKQLLELPKMWTYKQVAEHLLAQFHITYPAISSTFYEGVVEEILRTRKISSTALHHDWKFGGKLDEWADTFDTTYEEDSPKFPSWVRYCFSDPSKSKHAKNSYISHPPQALNAQSLNKSFLSVFHDIAMNPEHQSNFKLIAQIHDSILFQYRIGHEYLCDMVKERMEIPVTIKAYDDKIRTFVVPAGIKKGDHLEGTAKGKANYWSETE